MLTVFTIVGTGPHALEVLECGCYGIVGDVVLGTKTAKIRMLHALVLVTLLCGAFATANQSGDDARQVMECGTLANGYGPFDYTDPAHVNEKLPIVEDYHFNIDVELLTGGMSSEYPGSDLDYTLRAFPNHHRALYSMANLALRDGASRLPPGARWSADCYFQRAIRFRPDDATVRSIYGIYFVKLNDLDGAKEQFVRAVTLAPKNAEAHYNLGLVYEKLGDDVFALKHAKIAYKLGFPLGGLRAILQRKGVWESD